MRRIRNNEMVAPKTRTVRAILDPSEHLVMVGIRYRTVSIEFTEKSL